MPAWSKKGPQVEYLDLGGGLAVDYDGSQSNFLSSRNYSLNEYCTDIIEAVMTSLDEQKHRPSDHHHRNGPGPGRLLFDPAVQRPRQHPVSSPILCRSSCPRTVRPSLEYMLESLNGLTIRNIQETLNDAIFYRDETRQLFQPRQDQPAGTVARRKHLLDHPQRDQPDRPRKLKNAQRRTHRHRPAPLRYLLLQFQRLPVPARQLGHRSAVPDHADPPAQREADPQRHPRRHHLRLRRQDRPASSTSAGPSASCLCTS